MQGNSLAKILYQVDSKKAAEPCEGCRVVIVDKLSGRVHEKKPLLSFGKELRYFRVFSRSLAVEGKGPRCEIQGGSFDQRLELDILYRARCPAGEEERVARSLGLGSRPDLELNRWLQKRLEEFLAEQGSAEEVYSGFSRLHREAERRLSQLAPGELGLSLQVQIQRRGGEMPERVDIQIQDLGVHAKDSDELVKISLEAQLEVSDSAAVLRHAATPGDWRQRLGETVRRFIATQVGLHELTYELRTGLRRRLQLHLDEFLLEPAGRRLGFLRLAADIPASSAVEHLRLEHAVVCDIRGSIHQIRVQHVLQLKLRDLGKFRVSGIEDLDAWLRERLDATTRGLLFEKSFRDLLVDFAPGESGGPEQLRSLTEAQVDRIGYALQQMTVIPDLEPLKWKDGLSIELEGVFATLDSRVEVGIGLVVDGRIPDIFIPHLDRYLDPQAAKDLIEDIKKKATETLAVQLHGLSPERIYMRWFRSDRPGEEGVLDILHRAVSSALTESFGFVQPRIVIKPLETELTQRVEALMSRLYPLTVTVYPLGGKGQREPVTFTTNVEILRVHLDGWHVFRSRQFESIGEEVNEILRVLREEIEATLSTVPSEFLQFVDRGDHQTLRQVLDTTSETISRSFGLEIAFTGFQRQKTGAETQKILLLEQEVERETRLQLDAGEKRRNARLRQLEQQLTTEEQLSQDLAQELKLLLDRKKEFLKDGVEPEDEEYQAIQERIAEIRADLSPTEIEKRHDPLDHLNEKQRSSLRPEEYGVDKSRSPAGLTSGRRKPIALPASGGNRGGRA